MKYFAMMNRAKSSEMLGEKKDAIYDYESVIKGNPKFLTPYKELIKIYLKAKQKKEALHIIDYGLAHLPDSSFLLKQKQKIVGKVK